MVDLSALIVKYFPEEKILKNTKVFLTSSDVIKSGKLPLAADIGWIPAIMVETDKKFYFDVRSSSDCLMYFILSFAILAIPLSFFITSAFITILPRLIIAFILLFIFFIAGFIAYQIADAYKRIGNISLLKKEWITESRINGDESILKGRLVNGELTTLASQLIIDKKITPSLIINLFYRISTQINSLFSVNFSVRIKEYK